MKSVVLFFGIVVGDAGRAVVDVDDAAASEAVAFHQCLHDLIILVGVDAQVFRSFEAVIGGMAEDSAFFSVAADAVDGTVGTVVEPGAVFDHGVGGVLSQNKGENAVDALFLADEASAFGNILLNQFPLGVAADPLAVVAVLPHIFFGRIVDPHDLAEIGGGGPAYIHISVFLSFKVSLLYHIPPFFTTVLQNFRDPRKKGETFVGGFWFSPSDPPLDMKESEDLHIISEGVLLT